MTTRGEKIAEILYAQHVINNEQYQEIIHAYKNSGAANMWSLLLKQHYVTPEKLSEILGELISIKKKKQIGEILVEHGLITMEQLDAGLREQKRTGQRIGECLVSIGAIEREKLLDVLSAQLDVQHVVLEHIEFDSKLIVSFPRELVDSYNVIPLYEREGVITLAMADPTNRRTIDHIRFRTGKEIEPVIATRDSIRRAIAAQFPHEGRPGDVEDIDDTTWEASSGLTSSLDGPDPVVPDGQRQPEKKDGETNLSKIIEHAREKGVSIIHCIGNKTGLDLFFRIDGALYRQQHIDPPQSRALYAVLNGAQDGKSCGRSMSVRESTLCVTGVSADEPVCVHVATIGGSPRSDDARFVLHIVNAGGRTEGMDEIGFDDDTRNALASCTNHAAGLILVTGSDQHIKRQSVYSLLDAISTASRSVMSIEDPVTVPIPGIVQTQVDHTRGLTVKKGIDYAQRHDIDVLLIDELRSTDDLHSALLAASHCLIIAGISSFHPAEVYRMCMNDGVSAMMASQRLLGALVFQRLSRVCSECSRAYTPRDDEARALGVDPSQKLFRGEGCVFCSHTGFNGSIGVYGYLTQDEVITRMLLQADDDMQVYDTIEQRLGNVLPVRARALVQEGKITADQARTIIEHKTRSAETTRA